MANPQLDIEAARITIRNAMTGRVIEIDTDQDVRNFRKFMAGMEQDFEDFNKEAERFSAKLNREVLTMEIFTIIALGAAALLIGIPLVNYLRNR